MSHARPGRARQGSAADGPPGPPAGDTIASLAPRLSERRPTLPDIRRWNGLPPGAALFESLLDDQPRPFDAELRALGGAWAGRTPRVVRHLGAPLAVAVTGQVRLLDTVPSAAAALLRTGGIPPGVTTVNVGGERPAPAARPQVAGITIAGASPHRLLSRMDDLSDDELDLVLASEP